MRKKLILTIAILIVVLLFGTFGYIVIEKWSFFDALYMTVITLATVGYGEIHPLSFAGRVFTIFLILSGISILLYTVSFITSFFIEGQLRQILRRKKMLKQISQLKNHYIVCGVGKVGSHIISELAKTNRKFVIIERNKDLLDNYSNYLYINGDATDENILKQAGIENAAGLFASLSTDEENIFLIITAREINSNMKIVAKSVLDTSAKKLISAGATSVVQPNLIGGLRMASEMVRPAAVSFLDMMLKEGKGDLRVEEVEVVNNEKQLSTIQSHKSGVLILALFSKGNYIFNPAHNTTVNTGDKIIVMGNSEQVTMLKDHL
ncbi:MAG: hypothetical protein A2474_01290 [Elusimicrobia bacterium RIFOXYC2_FULL_34_12]|nr:MAG: hypothetical protein A2474_01290 [Elusimicrobia bacterium RIFOXYC2_FULL_34_12]